MVRRIFSFLFFPVAFFSLVPFFLVSFHSETIGSERQVTASKRVRRLRKQNVSPPYAYAFVIGGIHEDRPAYKGFLYDVLLAVNLLQKLGSQADFWIWTQLSPDSSLEELPEEDLMPLKQLGVNVVSLGRAKYETFSHLMMEKFRPLQLTQYKRVMYLDSDIIPLVNLDYLFHLSDPDHSETPTILRPNLIVATRGEPCNGGLYILEPEPGGWEQLEQIIQRQKEEGRQLPYPHFDYKSGWGYHFRDQNDQWEAIHRNGTQWHFHASHSDQGLLYYWTKFVKQDVSIIIGDRVQNWMPSNGGVGPIKEREMTGEPLAKYSSPTPLAYQFSCDKDKKSFHTCIVPYRDFAHFMGKNKPWQMNDPNRFLASTDTNAYSAATRVWFNELIELNKKLNLGIDVENWYSKHYLLMKSSPLGTMPKWKDNLLELNETAANGTVIVSNETASKPTGTSNDLLIVITKVPTKYKDKIFQSQINQKVA